MCARRYPSPLKHVRVSEVLRLMSNAPGTRDDNDDDHSLMVQCYDIIKCCLTRLIFKSFHLPCVVKVFLQHRAQLHIMLRHRLFFFFFQIKNLKNGRGFIVFSCCFFKG